ncbi:MAG: dTDP-4-dehydrorhamnose 3,5-epimerase family protein [Syntrophaceae bacterium]|nr:dTDP-4-dehydrorhamnose 3,5-epimerase family protein [Syntrophaceae bacterium]
MENNCIDGVVVRDLVTHSDERGFFREIIRRTDDFFQEGFGQWSHSLMFDGVIKAWHFHRIQTDWWYVVSGVMRVGLCDMREKSKSYKMTMDFLAGDYQPARILKIPPGVAHGCKAIQGPVHLLYVTSHIYNPDDEIRIPYDDPQIDFDWLKGPPIK